jgi:cyanophycinase
MNQERINDCPVPNGTLIIIGGHEDKGDGDAKQVQKGQDPFEILKAFIKATGKTDPVIEVITSAGGEATEAFQEYEKAFGELKISYVGHIHHDNREDVLMADLMERIQQADGIFIAGGDQLKLTSIYGGTQVLVEIKQRYIHEKLVLAGTSAGAMAMSTPMIYAGNKEKQQITGEVKVATGLEFLKDVCIDTHFVDRGRFVRMAQVIATNPTCIGVGIEEDTAIIVRRGIEVEVIGSGIAIVVDGFAIADSNITEFGPTEKIFIRDLTVRLLARGYHYTIPQNNPPHI